MATSGEPISVSFLTSQVQLVDITAKNQDGADVTPTGLTFNSDTSLVVVTVSEEGPNTFAISGAVGSPGVGSVTFTDAFGDTVVVNVTTTDAPPPVDVITLIATARPIA